MDKYTEFKEVVDNNYIASVGVNKDEGTISLLNLLNILKSSFETLAVTMNGSELKEQINQDRTITERIGVFKKRKVIIDKCTSVISNYGRKKCRISFGFYDKNRSSGHKFVVLMKDRESDELYFESEQFTDRNFAQKYVGEIYAAFAVLEEYADYFPINGKGEPMPITQTFDDGVLTVTITIYINGNVSYTIVPSKGTSAAHLFDREWLNREKLSSYVDNNALSILSNILVSTDELNSVFKKMVEASREREINILTKNIGGMAN